MEKVVALVGQAHFSLEIATFAVTVLGVGVVALYTYFAYRQNKLTEKALIYGRRAWLVSISQEVPAWRSASSLTAEITMENIGGVPALIKRYGADVVSGKPLPAVLSLVAAQWKTSGIIVPPGKSVRLETYEVCGITRDDTGAGKGEIFAPFYYYFIVDYTDCFEKKWRTCVCYAYNDTKMAFEAVPDLNVPM